MRAALTFAAFAATALAVPYKRDMLTDVNMVYVTQVVTVTAGQPGLPAAAPTPVAEPPPVQHYGHKKKPAHAHPVVHTTVVEITPSSQAPAPQEPAPTSQAPAPQEEAATSQAPAPALPSISIPSLPAPAGAPASYQQTCVDHHNLHRRNHTVPDVEWDDNLASIAAAIAASCVYAHNTEQGGGGYGQNIAAGVEANNISAIITDMFYNGEEPYYAGYYGQQNPPMTDFDKWGHFSQIVWKGTTHVGCATQYCPNGLANTGSGVSPYFTVCNYATPGNYAGEYGDNVLQPIGMPTANWNTGSSSY